MEFDNLEVIEGSLVNVLQRINEQAEIVQENLEILCKVTSQASIKKLQQKKSLVKKQITKK
jgi:hypothetical protein